MSNMWDGTHKFIWQPWNVLGGDANAMIAAAKQMGITGVLLKFADGSLAGDPNSQRFMSEFQRLAPLLKAAGIRVGGWIYQYLTDVQGEVDACVQAVEAGADWLVLDAEGDVAGRTAQVEQFGQLLRAKLPHIQIGFSSFAVASLHQEVPFDAYNAFIDVMMPQMYWATIGWSVDVTFQASVASYAKYGKPIAPTGQAYGEATPADMARYIALCNEKGYTGASWWDWQHASADQLAAIKANLILPLTPPAQTVAQPLVAPQSGVQMPNDVPADHWVMKDGALAWVLENEIMHNDDAGNFHPDEPMTRAQAARLAFNLFHQHEQN